MSFDARDVRRGKDVFDADGTYIGTVIWVFSTHADALPLSRGSAVGVADVRAAQRRASGAIGVGDPMVGVIEGIRPVFSGEATGPMPTAALGNSGPRRQSQTTAYATSSAPSEGPAARPPSELVVLRLLTSLNWSTLRPRVWRIPVSLVQAVSHERIVLSARAHDLNKREARRVPGLSDRERS